MDPLGFYRRRPDSPTSVVEFDDWMTGSVRNKENVDATLCFQIDYKVWLTKLTDLQRNILDLLIQGYRASKISEMVDQSAGTVRNTIKQLKELFMRFFHMNVQCA